MHSRFAMFGKLVCGIIDNVVNSTRTGGGHVLMPLFHLTASGNRYAVRG